MKCPYSTTGIAKYLVLVVLFFFLQLSSSSLVSQSYTCENTGLSNDVETLRVLVSRSLSQKSIQFADSLLVLFSERGLLECREALWTYNHKADAYELEKRLTISIGYYNEVLPVALKKEYWELLAETYISLARSHEIAGRGLDCKRNLDEAHNILKTYDFGRTMARLSMRSSSYYRIYENRVDTALVLAERAVLLGKKHRQMRAVCDGYLLLGMMTNDINIRLQHFISGRDVNFELDAYHAAMMFNNTVAGIYLEKGDIDLAEKTVRKSFEYSRLLKESAGRYGHYNNSFMSETHKMLGVIYQRKGILDSMSYHRDEAEKFALNVKLDKNQNRISELEIKNAVEIEKIKSDFLNKKLANSRILSSIVGLGLLLFGFFSFYLFRSRGKIREQNEEIVIKNLKLNELSIKQDMLLSEVHHRVKNNLQNIVSLLMMQENRVEDEEVKMQFKTISSKIYSIALIHEQLYRDGEFEIICMDQYFTDLTNHYRSLADKSMNVDFMFDVNDVCLNIETVIPLGLICSELITNSFKYASINTSLKIYLEMTKVIDSDRYKLVYSDNGVGYPESVVQGGHTGMGMTIIKGMARQIMADLVIKNQDGAITELTFKQKEVSKI